MNAGDKNAAPVGRGSIAENRQENPAGSATQKIAPPTKKGKGRTAFDETRHAVELLPDVILISALNDHRKNAVILLSAIGTKIIVFRQTENGILVRVQYDNDRVAFAEPLNQDTLKNELLKHLNIAYEKMDKDSGEKKYVPGYVSIAVLKAMLALDLEDTTKFVPELRGIINHPFLSKDRTIVEGYGYNKETGYFVNSHVQVSILNPDEAMQVLDDVYGDFPWASQGDLHAAMLMPLTMICKQAYSGATPMFSVNASKEGTGKSLSVQATCAGITGQLPALGCAPPDDAEMEKRLTTVIISGATTHIIDNIPTKMVFDFPSLVSAVSARRFSGRMLGYNKPINAPFEVLVIYTGNNITVTPEAARRTIPVLLTEKVKTDYRHKDLIEYCIQNSPRIVSAFITLAKWGLENSAESAFTLDGFEAWAAVIGRIAAALGWEDALDRQRETYTESVNGEFSGVEGFLADAYKLDMYSYTTTDLLPAAEAALLVDELKSKKAQSIALGRIITKIQGRKFGEYRIRKAAKSGGLITYKIEKEAEV
ncbi:hypothetical protein FACS1894163_09310 [Spirochaetia bacterium]|nr:hypothetical protein FACS1894163_09310 [Spirochaetia bacterium]